MKAEIRGDAIVLETESPAEKHLVLKLFAYKKKPAIKTNKIHLHDGTTIKHQFLDPLEVKAIVRMMLCDYDRGVQITIVPEEPPENGK